MDLHSLYFVCISTKLAKDIHISLNSERFWRQSLYWGNVKFRQSAIISVSSDVRFTNHSGNAIKLEPFERPMYVKILPHLLSQPGNMPNWLIYQIENRSSFKEEFSFSSPSSSKLITPLQASIVSLFKEDQIMTIPKN